MEHRCKCGKGYAKVAKVGDRPKIIDAQNIRLSRGVVTCAACNERICDLFDLLEGR